MQVTVQYAAQLASAAGLAEETLELDPETGLLAFVAQLCERHGPGFSVGSGRSGEYLRHAIRINQRDECPSRSD